MATIIVKHLVNDFTAWKSVFDSMAPLRKSYGELSSQVLQDVENPNCVTLLFNWDSNANAQIFFHSVELKKGMQESGVASPPSISFMKES